MTHPNNYLKPYAESKQLSAGPSSEQNNTPEIEHELKQLRDEVSGQIAKTTALDSSLHTYLTTFSGYVNKYVLDEKTDFSENIEMDPFLRTILDKLERVFMFIQENLFKEKVDAASVTVLTEQHSVEVELVCQLNSALNELEKSLSNLTSLHKRKMFFVAYRRHIRVWSENPKTVPNGLRLLTNHLSIKGCFPDMINSSKGLASRDIELLKTILVNRLNQLYQHSIV